MFGPLAQASKELMNWTGVIVAFSLLTLLSFLVWAFVFREIPASNRDPMLIVLGLLSANINAIVGFYFGTSYGSQKKTDTIEKLTRGGP